MSEEPVIAFGQQPCGFFPRRFLVAKIRTARRLQAEIGGRVVYFCHDSDHDPRETRTLLRHRATGQLAHLNFAVAGKLQRKFAPLYAKLQTKHDVEDDLTRLENRFSASTYQVVHFVVDMPLRVPPEMLKKAPAQAHNLGPVIFVLTEFQILDRHTEQRNELGDASHAAYKERQKHAVGLRLKVGMDNAQAVPPSKKPPA